MSLINFFAIMYWPLGALTTLLLFVVYRRRGTTTKRQNLIGFLIVCPLAMSFLIFFPYVLGNQSAIALIDIYILFCVAGAIMLLALFAGRKDFKGRIARLCVAAMGAVILYYGASSFVGDFILPRLHIEGTVENAVKTFSSRAGYFYEIHIDGQRYNTTADIFSQLHSGERVRAEIGVGSHNIFKIEKL